MKWEPIQPSLRSWSITTLRPAPPRSILNRPAPLEIRDDYGVAASVPESHREIATAAHAVSHRMLRIFESVRASHGEDRIDHLYSEWGRRFFIRDAPTGDELLTECLDACGLDRSFLAAADEEKWDVQSSPDSRDQRKTQRLGHLIAPRRASLPPASRQVLDLAAVAGGPLDARLLSKVLGCNVRSASQ